MILFMLAAANSSGTNRLLKRTGFPGDPEATKELFGRHRERLRKMVRLRLDWRLRGRISSTSILDKVLDQLSLHAEDFPRDEGSSFFLWLRELTAQEIDRAHRQHLGDRADEAGRELQLNRGSLPNVTPAAMAAQLLGDRSATQTAARADLLTRLQGALNGMDALDRELLALRQFEELTIEEAAAVLGLTKGVATVRYLQAVKRLNEVLSNIPGFLQKRS
jgi:RNA polymerase sigma-70 factor (ECF subfamily)